ncbi:MULTISPECIES: alpha/beta fold hydrolase [unclassified Nocardia]|uniref:alpha/beta fold hydrolase n=1 Tax=unclassified Nocardia TaxID=2637762 RepID=UPI001CE4A34F|nr:MULTISPECIES: alpha/beta hydrolase [unclassified Nocardia]
MRSSRLREQFGVPGSSAVPGGRLVELPGGRTYVVDIPGPDDAPTLLLLHGAGCTAYLNWFPALTELAAHFRVVLYDQRWHGRGIRADRFRIADCADDVVAVLDALGVDGAICAGYSLGGVVGLLAAHRYPDRVRGLVLCATPYRFQEKWRERAFHRAYGALAAAFGSYAYRRASEYCARLPEMPECSWAPDGFNAWALGELRSTSGWAVSQVIAEVGRFDAGPWLGALRAPTAVVITTRDHAIPVYRQLEMATMIPGATIHLVNGGHAACVLRADRFVPVLVRACADVAARQAGKRGLSDADGEQDVPDVS